MGKIEGQGHLKVKFLGHDQFKVKSQGQGHFKVKVGELKVSRSKVKVKVISKSKSGNKAMGCVQVHEALQQTQTGGRTDRWKDGWTDGRMDR